MCSFQMYPLIISLIWVYIFLYTENRDHWWRWGRCHWNDAFRHGANAEPSGVQGKYMNINSTVILFSPLLLYVYNHNNV